MMNSPQPRFIIAGNLRRDTILLPDGRVYPDIAGGSLFYAASGLKLWEDDIGLVGRVGRDYPSEWIEKMNQHGLDTQGIRVVAEEHDVRSFKGYDANGVCQENDPVAQFARLHIPYPKNLLGLQISPPQLDSRTRLSPLAIHHHDIPSDYLNANAVHLCPLDYLTHSLLPSTFQQGHITTVTLDPGAGYMNPTFFNDLPAILVGLTAFLTNEEKIRSLFYSRTSDLWEMAQTLAGYGCDIIVIKRGSQGQLLYDHTSQKKWMIPAYPARCLDPTGAGDAFCGGFLGGYRRTYDPLEAVLYGNISASFTIEGIGTTYTMEAFPTLAESRLQALKDMVRQA